MNGVDASFGAVHITLSLPCETKDAELAHMSPQKLTIAALAVLPLSLAVADDFKTINSKEYKNATVTRVEPDGILVRTRTGITKIYFAELPPEARTNYTKRNDRLI